MVDLILVVSSEDVVVSKFPFLIHLCILQTISRFQSVLLVCLLSSASSGNFLLANSTSKTRQREFTNELL